MKTRIYVALSATLGIALMTAHAQPGGQKMPEPRGKITPWEAIKIATARVPGRALNANFEFDEGKWVYGVVVVSGKTLKEVEIDPMTGKIGDTETITPAGEARETMQELSAAIGIKMAPGKGEKDEEDEKDEKPTKGKGG